MKLYTEEQVRKAIELAQECEHECGGVYFDYTETEIIERLTPIELPSDEEIKDQANKVHNELFDEFYSYTDGAKWLRDKIINQTKTNKPMKEEVLKELIKEMENRVAAFQKNLDLNKEIDASHGYWDGKRSEAAFMVEKLTWILENDGF